MPRLPSDLCHAVLGAYFAREAMSVAEEFRAKAIECFERARRAQDSEYQRIYYNLAIQWLAWAAEIDGRGVVDPAILPPSAQRRRA